MSLSSINPCLNFHFTTPKVSLSLLFKQTIKLYIYPDINIKNGSKIIVTQNGKKQEYKNSGEPARYETHQEIMLELFKGWA